MQIKIAGHVLAEIKEGRGTVKVHITRKGKAAIGLVVGALAVAVGLK